MTEIALSEDTDDLSRGAKVRRRPCLKIGQDLVEEELNAGW